jgi:hypothetical protein
MQLQQDVESIADLLELATSALAVNLLRVLAGAGASRQLASQMTEVLEHYHAVRKFGGSAYRMPMAQALSLRDKQRSDLKASDHFEAEIIREALRMVAAHLAGQPRQHSRAASAFRRAIRDYEEAIKNEWKRKRDKAPRLAKCVLAWPLALDADITTRGAAVRA